LCINNIGPEWDEIEPLQQISYIILSTLPNSKEIICFCLLHAKFIWFNPLCNGEPLLCITKTLIFYTHERILDDILVSILILNDDKFSSKVGAMCKRVIDDQEELLQVVYDDFICTIPLGIVACLVLNRTFMEGHCIRNHHLLNFFSWAGIAKIYSFRIYCQFNKKLDIKSLILLRLYSFFYSNKDHLFLYLSLLNFRPFNLFSSSIGIFLMSLVPFDFYFSKG